MLFSHTKVETGRPFRYRSINIGNALDAPRGISWGVSIESNFFAAIHQAGFNAVRLPVRFSDYVQAAPNYVLDPEFMKKIDDYLSVAYQQQLTVILDLHHFIELMDNPLRYHDCFLSIWDQLATRYRDQPNTLLFEVLNEPTNKLSGDLWNHYLAEAISVIRRTNSTRPLIVGPDHFNSLHRLHALRLPKDPNLIVSFHYYEPNAFTFQENPYLGFTQARNVAWLGTPTDLRQIHEDFAYVKRWATRHHVPIYLGEFGANQAAANDSRRRWTEAVRREAETLAFGWGYWELASWFGIYDPETRTWDQALLDVLLPEVRD
ncbi:glycoside hydrolase family 5 protein [Sporolactobacillus spathodeae]|uniref:Endoglucanase n=1 Tax=Sporolactobacillus spathodeae TaxID=1465502 RepID=A0ABS2Q752_9BACL|nr:glycoside hydrolase family 5 protein [Sporolactobacillus spathodeae]MBM7657416.1 endoglucanase [Sporolactobacillus spathodeae]